MGGPERISAWGLWHIMLVFIRLARVRPGGPFRSECYPSWELEGGSEEVCDSLLMAPCTRNPHALTPVCTHVSEHRAGPAGSPTGGQRGQAAKGAGVRREGQGGAVREETPGRGRRDRCPLPGGVTGDRPASVARPRD